MNDEELETRAIRGEEAKQLLANPLLKQAFEAVDGYLLAKAHACDLKTEKAERVITAMQIFESFKREFTRRIEDGELAKFQMRELEKQNVIQRVFRR